MARRGRDLGTPVARAARRRPGWALLALLFVLLGACAGPGAQATPTLGLDLSPTETPAAPAPSAELPPTATVAPSPTPTRAATATTTPRPTATATGTRRPTTQATAPTPTPMTLSNPSKLTRLGLEEEAVALVAAGGVEGGAIFAAGKGVLRSRDGGETWQAVRSADDAPKVTALVVAPSDPRVVYVGVSAGCAASGKQPGFASQDGGDTWTAIGSSLLSIAVDPRNPQLVYAVDCRGLARSANGGRSWTVMENSPVPAGATALVAVAPGASQNLYVAVDMGPAKMAIARTANRGETWQAVTPRIEPNLKVGQVLNGAPTNIAGARPIAMAVDATNPAIVLLSTTQGIFRTDDAGAKWALVGEGLENVAQPEGTKSITWLNTALVGDPRKAGAFWIGTGATKVAGVGLYRTRDRGDNWRKPTTGLEGRSILSLALGGPADGRILYVGTDKGIWALSAP